MHSLKPVVAALLGACLLTACIGPGPADQRAPLRIQPLTRVEHGGTTDAQSWYRLGRDAYGRGDLEQARKAYIEALVLQPKYADAHSALGVVYADQGRLEDAVRAFQAAIALAPTDAYLRNNLGYAHLLQGQSTAAEAAFRDALRVDPAHAGAQLNLLVALRRQGKAVDAPMVALAPPAPTPAAVEREPQPRVAMDHIVGTPLPPESAEARSGGFQVELEHGVPPVVVPTPTPAKAAQPMPAAIPAASTPAGQPAKEIPAAKGRQSALKPVVIEVSNASGVAGVARVLASRLDGERYVARRVSRSSSASSISEIRYREGYRAQAETLAAHIPGPVRIVQSLSLHAGVQIGLVLGTAAADGTQVAAAARKVIAGNI